MSVDLTSNDLVILFYDKNKKLHFSPNLFWLFQRNTVGILFGVRGTVFGNMTSNDLDLGNDGHLISFDQSHHWQGL